MGTTPVERSRVYQKQPPPGTAFTTVVACAEPGPNVPVPITVCPGASSIARAMRQVPAGSST